VKVVPEAERPGGGSQGPRVEKKKGAIEIGKKPRDSEEMRRRPEGAGPVENDVEQVEGEEEQKERKQSVRRPVPTRVGPEDGCEKGSLKDPQEGNDLPEPEAADSHAGRLYEERYGSVLIDSGAVIGSRFEKKG
jgi:hypothetical protein